MRRVCGGSKLRESSPLPADFFSGAELSDPVFRDRLSNGPPSCRIRRLLRRVQRSDRMTPATAADVLTVWQQLIEDDRRNGKTTTRLRSSGPAARRALRQLHEELGSHAIVLGLTIPREPERGRPRDTLRKATAAFDGSRLVGEQVLLVLKARAEARRRSFTRRTPKAFDAAVLNVLEEWMPTKGLYIGQGFAPDKPVPPPGPLTSPVFRTPIVLAPAEAARSLVKNYSWLADKLRGPRAVKARFHLDHRTSRMRRSRRTAQTHT